MTKIISLIVFLQMFYLDIFGQNRFFNGEIVFQQKITFLNQNYKESYSKFFCESFKIYYNEYNYKILYDCLNNPNIIMQLYRGNSNRFYQLNGDGSVINMGADEITEKIIKIEYSEHTKEILNKKCNIVIFTFGDSIHRYYYENTLKQNIDIFAKHTLDNMNETLKAMKGAIPLKIEVENNIYLYESEAISIRELELDNSFFEIPISKKTNK